MWSITAATCHHSVKHPLMTNQLYTCFTSLLYLCPARTHLLLPQHKRQEPSHPKVIEMCHSQAGVSMPHQQHLDMMMTPNTTRWKGCTACKYRLVCHASDNWTWCQARQCQPRMLAIASANFKPKSDHLKWCKVTSLRVHLNSTMHTHIATFVRTSADWVYHEISIWTKIGY